MKCFEKRQHEPFPVEEESKKKRTESRTHCLAFSRVSEFELAVTVPDDMRFVKHIVVEALCVHTINASRGKGQDATRHQNRGKDNKPHSVRKITALLRILGSHSGSYNCRHQQLVAAGEDMFELFTERNVPDKGKAYIPYM